MSIWVNIVNPPTIGYAACEEIKCRMANQSPYEACGLVLGSGRVIELDNVARDKLHNFEMETDVDYPDVVAIWHTHPCGPAHPSDTDIKMMKLMVEQGFPYHFIIASPEGVLELEVEADRDRAAS